jgi:bifunctional non-homologous end joining protein LigD
MASNRRNADDSLSEYRRKRSFPATPEPSGDTAAATAENDPHQVAHPRFVVHEHHARRLHWDLRLEHDGALASWAVPNGIPTDPAHNRKAIHVEDHPLDYIDFAGSIPTGNYGAGEVSIWDRGTYEIEKWEPEKITVVFAGTQLRGRYALFQTGRDSKDWMIHRMDAATDATAAEPPEFIAPMLAKLSTLPRADSDWAFEIKWDGVRAILRSEPGRLRLYSRNENDITAAYPELHRINDALGSSDAILDGEIVAFDGEGRPSFQALQGRMHLRGETAVNRMSASTPVTFMIFDLLWLDGHSLLDRPYRERRAHLEALSLHGEHWRVPEFHQGNGAALLEVTREHRLEGIVGKPLSSRYLPGKRSPWIKVKNYQRQELVIGGWTSGQGNRGGSIGALHLGVHDADGALHYVGRVGTGFDAAELERLARLFTPLIRAASPFRGRQPPKGAHYVEPELVCEIEFSEWTRTGTVRQASYKGLRDDKAAVDVVRERPSEPANATAGAAADRAMTPDLTALIQDGRRVRDGVEIELEGRTLKLTNLDKVLYPETGFTKRDLVAYYGRVAPVLLPHLHDRPLTLKRYPNGVDGEFFYEKRSPPHRPDWVQTVAIASDRGKAVIPYTLCQDLPTLVWLANLADLELHPSLSLAQDAERPTSLAFDLDPGAPAGLVECSEVALQLRALFDGIGLKAYAKTSGSKGIQVYVPLNTTEAGYAHTKPFAHAVAAMLEQRHPDLVVSAMAKLGRRGKVLIDWSQNDAHKTTVNVYSLRATERPTVSTPLRWSEVIACRDQRQPRLLRFGPDQVLERVAEHGDLFAPVLEQRQRLPWDSPPGETV